MNHTKVNYQLYRDYGEFLKSKIYLVSYTNQNLKFFKR